MDAHEKTISELLKESSLETLTSDSVEDAAVYLSTITPWDDTTRAEFASNFSLMEDGSWQSVDPDALKHAAYKGVKARAIIHYASRLAGKTTTERHDALTEYLDRYTQKARGR